MARDALQLENERISLEIVPEFGARVTALIDRNSGRNWLVAGPCEGEPDEAALFGVKEARGWDECFPTVAPCPSAIWQHGLRDHGDLWGRAWQYEAGANSLTLEYRAINYRFQRRLTLEGASVEARYEVENLGEIALPYLWSQHCLLDTRAGEKIILDGVCDLKADGISIEWPGGPDGQDQSRIRGVEAGFAQKAYARVVQQANVGVDGANEGIRLTWNANDAAYFGLWRNYGGWLNQAGVHHIALEPTTAPADDLATAKTQNKHVWLQPGAIKRWSVSIQLYHN